VAAVTDIRVSEVAPATLALVGVLNFDTAAEALHRAGERLRDGHHDTLDLGGITAVDSAGLACVLAVMAAARRHGRTLKVTRMPADLTALAQVSEVDGLLA
jgi:phospholipid transport system transporter-binding protein